MSIFSIINRYQLIGLLTVSCLVGCGALPNYSQQNHGNNDKQKLDKLYQTLTHHSFLPKANANQSPLKVLDCQTLQSGKIIELTGNSQIPKHCDLWQKNAHFVIQKSDVSLDCQGVLMSSQNNNLTAFTIQTPKNFVKNQGIRNISLKNCAVSGYRHGLLIQQQLPANQRYQQFLKKETSLDAQKQQSPQMIDINRLLVANSKHSGIFIGDHVQNVNIINSMVINSGTVGIYFEFGSGQSLVKYSQFFGNGFRQILGMGKPNREAIAIDSSNHNEISHNQFQGNGAGGVFLYRNCFEHANDPTKNNHFLRTQGSDNNQIFANYFINEPVGVWVASRQSRNLKGFACGAYLIEKTTVASYHLDEAEHNTVQQNHFTKTEKAIIVEDDNNIIRQNRFDNQVKFPIIVGSLIREKSDEGVVKNNQILNNEFYQRNLTTPLIKFVGNSVNKTNSCGNIAKNATQQSVQPIDNSCLVN